MNRRDFLEKFSKSAATCGAATAAVAIGVNQRSRATLDSGTALIKSRLQALEDRADQLDASQKRLLKIIAVSISVSTGVDIATLL